MATVPHVASGLGLRKFQADGFLLTRVYKELNFWRTSHGHKEYWTLLHEDTDCCSYRSVSSASDFCISNLIHFHWMFCERKWSLLSWFFMHWSITTAFRMEDRKKLVDKWWTRQGTYVKRNIGARSRNCCFHEKAISIIMGLCVYSCLSYLACKVRAPYCIVVCVLSGCTIFPALSHKWYEFWERFIEHQICDLIFSGSFI